MKKRVAIYVRVSTAEQAKEGYSIGEQEERLRKYCEAMDWRIVQVYVDPGFSGGDTNRPGLKALLKDVKKGKFDGVVVYKLDRLSRSQKDTLYLIEDEFLAHGIDFVSMSENFDTSTPFGRAMVGILAVFAQLEREQIKERMIMGKDARAKEGKWRGGQLPIGYDYDPAVDDYLVLNKIEAMQLQEAGELFLQGTPIRAIARMFSEKGYKHKYGEYEASVIRRCFKNKLYLGISTHNGQEYPGAHDPIFDRETFDRINEILDRQRSDWEDKGITPRKITTLLGGLLYCGYCGAKFTKQWGGSYKYGRIYYYACHSRAKKVKKMIKDPNCKAKYHRVDELDEIVLNEIRKLSVDPDYIKELKSQKPERKESEDKIALLEKEVETINKQISKFMDLYSLDRISFDLVDQKIKPLSEQREKLESEINRIEKETSAELTEEETLELVQSFDEVIERNNFDEIRFLIESLISKIVLTDEDVNIYWRFA